MGGGLLLPSCTSCVQGEVMAKVSKTGSSEFNCAWQAALILLAVLTIILGTLISWAWFAMIQMPGES